VGGIRGDVIRDERFEELVEQERISLGRRVARLGERRVDTFAETIADDLGNGVGRQRPGQQHLSVRLARHLFEDGLICVGLGRPHACDERHRHVLQPPGEIGQKAERRGVAPVQVVHDQHQRSLSGEVDREPVEPVEPCKHALLGWVVRRHALAEHGRRAFGRPDQQPRPRVLRDEQRLVELTHDAEREVALELAAARRAHNETVLLAEGPRLGE
jgi:hypothetical protein